MKAKLLVVFGAIALIVPFVIAQQTDQRERQGTQAPEHRQMMRGQTGQEMMGGVKNVDQMFVKGAIQDNMFETQAAKLVSEKAPNEQVKQFAQKLADDHQQALEQVRKTAQTSRLQVPNRLENWQQEKLQALRQMDPESLQVHFLIGTIADHHKDILMNKWAAQKAQENEIRTLATRQVPALQQHLQEATRLTDQVLGIQAETGAGVTGR